MDRQITDRLKEFLKNEGFTQSTVQRSSVSQTLTASKDQLQIVVHLAEGVAVGSRAEAIANTPAHLIATRPMVPGFSGTTEDEGGFEASSDAGVSRTAGEKLAAEVAND